MRIINFIGIRCRTLFFLLRLGISQFHLDWFFFPIFTDNNGSFRRLLSSIITLTCDIIIVLKTDVQFLPISGLFGTNMKTRLDKQICPWWDGPCLFEALDAIDIPLRDPNGPLRYYVVFT